MPRATSISYWPTRKGGGYFCVRKGERFELALGPDDQPTGPTYRAAQDRFQEIMEGKAREEAEREKRRSEPERATIREVLDAYLKHVTKTKTSGTVGIRLRSFLPFVNHKTKRGLLGELAVCNLKHQDVYDFLEIMETVPRAQVRKKEQKGRLPTTWGPGSQRNFLQGVIAAFNWAVTGKMIDENPLDKISKPSAVSRGADALLGTNTAEIEAMHARIMGVSRPHWRPFIQALKDTGARPGELCAATATDFDEKLGAFVFRKEMSRRSGDFAHKNAKHKDRVIMLTGQTLATVKELVTLFPTGKVFRRKNGKPFGRVNVVDRFIKLRRRLKVKGLTAYSYRHTWATELIKAGMDVDTLASLMGNSAAVIRQHYSHLLADRQGLREKLERFKLAVGGS